MTATFSDVQAYVQAVARGDLDGGEAQAKCPEHVAALLLNDALYVGRKKDSTAAAVAAAAAAAATSIAGGGGGGPGRGGKKRPAQDSAASAPPPPAVSTLQSLSRPCSPSLFQQMDFRKHVKTASATSTATTMDETLSTVSQLLYVEDKSQLVRDDKLLPPLHSNTLGSVLLPIRRRTVLERWTLHEIAVFEAAISLHGKRFDLISPLLSGTKKTTQDVIEFYYSWKNSAHGKAWKDTYKVDYDDDGYG